MVIWKVKNKKKVVSTNDLLVSLAQRGEPAGLVIVAREQTAGRGQGWNRWYSPAGRGLYFSFLLRPGFPAAQLPRLIGLVAQSVRKTILGWDRWRVAKDFAFKKPNDFYWGRKKLGGVLLEAKSRGQKVDSVVIGVGINIAGHRWPRHLAGRAISLEEALAKKPKAKVFLERFLKNFSLLYDVLDQDQVRA